MILYHTTTTARLASIRAHGLDPSYAQGARAEIWLTSESKIHWALAHTQARHGATLDEIVTLEIEVPRSWLTRAWRGIWRCPKVIKVGRIRREISGAELAKSPIQ